MPTDRTEKLLDVSNLKKYSPVRQPLFQEKKYVRAVDDISFSMSKGEITGLVGESGSGKTTVAKTILQLIEPDGGSICFDGALLFDARTGRKMKSAELTLLRQKMQMVFQDPYASLDPRMDVEHIIMEGVKKHRLLPKEELHDRAVSLIEECGLDAGALRRFPHQFSGGQRQRIGIARALSMSPDLIICDEPTAALDVSVQSQVLNLMLSLQEKHRMSYLFITHNLSIVRHFCHRVCVMYLGKIVEIADAAALFSHSAHPYTKALVLATPSVKNTGSGQRQLLTGEIPSPANPPSGCKFHPRCPHATARCAAEEPQLRAIGEGHFAACHLSG